VPRPRVTDDHRLYAIDAVNADDFGIRHHSKAAVFRFRGSAEASAKSLRRPGAAGTQHHQHSSPAIGSVDSRGECGAVATAHNEIDRSGHSARLAATTKAAGGRISSML